MIATLATGHPLLFAGLVAALGGVVAMAVIRLISVPAHRRGGNL